MKSYVQQSKRNDFTGKHLPKQLYITIHCA